MKRESKTVRRVVYSHMIGDLFNYGHLKLLEKAAGVADYHVCGVISDEIARKWTSPLICSYEERKAVIEKIVDVDEVWRQDSMDPTANLRKLRQRFPRATVFLMQSHHMWSGSLGSDYIREIGGKIVPTDFYGSLSRDYMARKFFDYFIERKVFDNSSFDDLKVGDIDVFGQPFSTKAETLNRLRKSLKTGTIEKQFVFTVGQWRSRQKEIIAEIGRLFEKGKIVVRSSALNEDSRHSSNAGHFHSELDVDPSDPVSIMAAANRVINSYDSEGAAALHNQVLVQQQTHNISMSGVIFTRNLWTNTPYYLINYDDISQRTDTVTGGMAGSRTEILRDLPVDRIAPRWRKILRAVKEVEAFFQGLSLDIEFGLRRDGTVVIFQVRPLAANSKFHNLSDQTIRDRITGCQREYEEICARSATQPVFLSDMAFWNPAELIGDRPHELDHSIFHHLITKSNWNRALLPLGYTEVKEPLMVRIANKPFIQVQNAFRCLLPERLPPALKPKLLAFYAAKLSERPELHDKVEFEITHNCYTFDFERRLRELTGRGFTVKEGALLKQGVLDVTNGILRNAARVIAEDNRSIGRLDRRFRELERKARDSQDWREKLGLVGELIEDCRLYGINPFNRLARMAFISTSLLRSLREIGVLNANEVEEFMASITSVVTELDRDYVRLRDKRMSLGAFMARYGHLRPGTYDITRLPYAKQPDFFGGRKNPAVAEGRAAADPARLDAALAAKIGGVCREHGLALGGDALLDFMREAIRLREGFKFVYTRNISAALEIVAEVGEVLGFDREALAYLDYPLITAWDGETAREEVISTWRNVIYGRREEERIANLVSLPAVVFSKNDFMVVTSHAAKPNFVTDGNVEGTICKLDHERDSRDVAGRIVLIEKADPGYDWIFTKPIKGLITKYGGAASHMAIRCAELNLPGAIGCGELIYSKVLAASRVVLDCKNKVIGT